MKYREMQIAFIDWLRFIKNKSEKTEEQYVRHLLKFEDFLISINQINIEVDNITLKMVNDFRIYLHKNSKK
jgi:hypothetical protein